MKSLTIFSLTSMIAFSTLAETNPSVLPRESRILKIQGNLNALDAEGSIVLDVFNGTAKLTLVQALGGSNCNPVEPCAPVQTVTNSFNFKIVKTKLTGCGTKVYTTEMPGVSEPARLKVWDNSNNQCDPNLAKTVAMFNQPSYGNTGYGESAKIIGTLLLEQKPE